ncbi:hypothetical protein HC256_006203 [Beauveria bassiana]|nr:hypothetical protein HC256_006203 [Beauveria bassiana]
MNHGILAAHLATAAGRQLVAFAVTKGRRGAGRVTEGSVQTTRELGRVRHERRLMCDALLDELELDGADTAVIHVRRCNAVGASLGVSDSDIRDAVHRQLIVQAAVVAQDAAVAMRSIFAKADVGANVELREAAADETNGADDGAFGVVGRAGESVL